MKNVKMKAVRIYADWDQRHRFMLGPKDIEGRQAYLSSKVWGNHKIKIEEAADLGFDDLLMAQYLAPRLVLRESA